MEAEQAEREEIPVPKVMPEQKELPEQRERPEQRDGPEKREKNRRRTSPPGTGEQYLMALIKCADWVPGPYKQLAEENRMRPEVLKELYLCACDGVPIEKAAEAQKKQPPEGALRFLRRKHLEQESMEVYKEELSGIRETTATLEKEVRQMSGMVQHIADHVPTLESLFPEVPQPEDGIEIPMQGGRKLKHPKTERPGLFHSGPKDKQLKKPGYPGAEPEDAEFRNPRTGNPKSRQPEHGKPESGQPEPGKPESSKPEPGKSEDPTQETAQGEEFSKKRSLKPKREKSVPNFGTDRKKIRKWFNKVKERAAPIQKEHPRHKNAKDRTDYADYIEALLEAGYSSRQLDYLLDCIEEGMAVADIEKFSSPKLPVELMSRLRTIEEKRKEKEHGTG